MTKELRTYLQWCCRISWHVKYIHLIDKWIDKVLPYQCEYFEKEMKHLIDRGVYSN
jgi:hypothetical protein